MLFLSQSSQLQAIQVWFGQQLVLPSYPWGNPFPVLLTPFLLTPFPGLWGLFHPQDTPGVGGGLKSKFFFF